MEPEKIKVRVTETGQILDVVVYSKRADRIEIVLGEGIHNVKCEVQADLDKLNPKLREPRRR